MKKGAWSKDREKYLEEMLQEQKERADRKAGEAECLQKELRRMERLLKKQEALYEAQQADISAIRKGILALGLTMEEVLEAVPEEIVEEASDDLAVLLEDLTVVCVGGSESWNVLAKESMPYIKFFGSQLSEVSRMNDMTKLDILIINAKHVGHAATGTAKKIAKNKNAMVISTSESNLDKLREKLIERLTRGKRK